MTHARFELDPYTARVLDVVKGKFGLKNRNAALKKFVERHGTEYAEKRIEEHILEQLDKTVQNHKNKHKNRTSSVKELDAILEL